MRKKHRLRSNADFQRLRHEGRALRHPLLIVSWSANGLEHSRFGFVVGRRLGKAAERNRIKRRLREVVRVRMQAGAIASGWDVVLIARYPMRDASFHQVDEAIDLMLRRAGLVSEAS